MRLVIIFYWLLVSKGAQDGVEGVRVGSAERIVVTQVSLIFFQNALSPAETSNHRIRSPVAIQIVAAVTKIAVIGCIRIPTTLLVFHSHNVIN